MALLAPPDHADDYLDLTDLAAVKTQNITASKKLLQAADAKLNSAFYEWQNISRLVKTRAWMVEQFILALWLKHQLDEHHLALVAVGGFGRGDLQPHSDVDLLVLYHQTMPEDKLSEFIQDLWDLGLDVGHAVRTVDESVQLAEQDLSVVTNLMEGRFLQGEHQVYNAMFDRINDRYMWSGKDFFQAKFQEQKNRHKKWGDTAYNLEPNIKEGQGGLRDIQMVTWVAQRHFHVSSMHGLVDVGFLLPEEYIQLQKGRRKLWKIRYALHLLAGRKEDRLLFGHQKALAKTFGFKDDDKSLAVEKFMQSYYRNAMRLEQLNMSLLQLFEENILQTQNEQLMTEISSEFCIINQYLDVTDNEIFVKRPGAIFDVFHHYQQNPQVQGIRANTLRLISQHTYLIDDQFRQDESNKIRFLNIFKHRNLVFRQLELMNALGVLAAYLPVFERIVGRMQFDLFHMYTVDQHTLFVLRNIRQIFLSDKKHPFAHDVATAIKRPYVLNLAGFFHDIGKGRGGDHAIEGANEAVRFSQSFGLPKADAELLVWLVKYHLIMSVVAQKQDISDAQVIEKFAELVGTQSCLDHLYVLTVADISGTDPKLWNSYKDGLLQELYQRTSQFLQQKDHELTEQTKDDAIQLLDQAHHQVVVDLWRDFPNRFFDFSTPEQIAKVSQAISESKSTHAVCITDTYTDGFEIMLYGFDKLGLFNQVVEVFAEFQINVVSARIYSGADRYVLDYFHCLADMDAVDLEQLVKALSQVLEQVNSQPKNRALVVSRKEKIFEEEPQIRLASGRTEAESRLDIRCNDYAGLLVNITQIFVQLGIVVHAAKIGTFGHYADDVFWVSHQNKALDKDLKVQLVSALRSMLEAAG